MGAFFGALGHGLMNYGKQRLLQSRLGQLGQPALAGRFAPGQQLSTNEQIGDLDSGPATSSDNYMPPEDNQAPPPSVGDTSAGDTGGLDAFGGGKIVTTPTVAKLGDKGPEAVIPLTSQPGEKLSPGMLGGNPRTHWRRPSGPVGAKTMAPIRNDIPLRPNQPFK